MPLHTASVNRHVGEMFGDKRLKFVSVAVLLVSLGGCAGSGESVRIGAAPGQSTQPSASNSQPVRLGLIERLDQVAKAIGTAVTGDRTESSPTETGSAGPPVLQAGEGARAAAGPQVQIGARPSVAPQDTASPRRATEPRTPAPNAAVAYEAAMLRRDARAMARAVARLTRKPVTEETVREVNARLGIEADDEMVSAVARAAR